MNTFITKDGDTLVKFTDESLMNLAQQGVITYCLFEESDKSIKVRKSLTQITWDKEKEDFISFFSRVYPMGIRGCLGLFYNRKDLGDLK